MGIESRSQSQEFQISKEITPPPMESSESYEESESAKELQAVEWMKEVGNLSKNEIAKIRADLRGSGIEGERWGNFTGKLFKEEGRTSSDNEKLINQNLDKPIFTTGEYVTSGSRNFEILDPNPDVNGLVKVKEMEWEGSNIKWTEKNVSETELLGDGLTN